MFMGSLREPSGRLLAPIPELLRDLLDRGGHDIPLIPFINTETLKITNRGRFFAAGRKRVRDREHSSFDTGKLDGQISRALPGVLDGIVSLDGIDTFLVGPGVATDDDDS